MNNLGEQTDVKEVETAGAGEAGGLRCFPVRASLGELPSLLLGEWLPSPPHPPSSFFILPSPPSSLHLSPPLLSLLLLLFFLGGKGGGTGGNGSDCDFCLETHNAIAYRALTLWVGQDHRAGAGTLREGRGRRP